MAEDVEVLRAVWHSALPTCFRLADSEVTCLTPPPPLYAMVARLSYLPLVADKVVQHFGARHANNLWLESEGTPLKWHYPAGVLFDQSGASLPWSIVVHFENFPEDRLVRCGSRAALEALFMSAVKEADALKHAPDRQMAQLQKRDHAQLWAGAAQHKFEQFWAVNRKLVAKDMRHVPVRVHWPDTRVTQPLVRARHPDGRLTSFGDLTRQVAGPAAQEHVWLVQGVTPPPDTPLEWAGRHLAHCDNFVHVVAHPLNDSSHVSTNDLLLNE